VLRPYTDWVGMRLIGECRAQTGVCVCNSFLEGVADGADLFAVRGRAELADLIGQDGLHGWDSWGIGCGLFECVDREVTLAALGLKISNFYPRGIEGRV